MPQMRFRSDGGGAFAVDFNVKNFGNSPASNVELDADLPMMKSNMGSFAIQENICKKLKERPTGDDGGGLTIFLQEHIPQRIIISLQPGQVSNAVKSMGLPNHSFMPIIIGCIRYFYPADKSQHETGFAFYVSHRPPNALLGTDAGDVPSEEITFVSPAMLNSLIN